MTGRIIKTGKWKWGVKCPRCGCIPFACLQSRKDTLEVCPDCGEFVHYIDLAVRHIVRKTGFWFWQSAGHWESK